MAVRARLAPRRGISVDAVNSIVFWSLIGAIVGARVAYVIAHASDFASPARVARGLEGRISLLGGIAGSDDRRTPINIRRFGLRFFQVADADGAARPRDRDRSDRRPSSSATTWAKPTSWIPRVDLPRWEAGAPFTLPRLTRCQAALAGEPPRDHQARQRRAAAPGSRRSRTGVGVHQTAMYDMAIAWALFGVPLVVHRASPGARGTATLAFASRLVRLCAPAPRTSCGSTSASVRSRGRNGRRSPWWWWRLRRADRPGDDQASGPTTPGGLRSPETSSETTRTQLPRECCLRPVPAARAHAGFTRRSEAQYSQPSRSGDAQARRTERRSRSASGGRCRAGSPGRAASLSAGSVSG